ncbi:DUF2828 family protein [Mycolicibacterium phlei]|uniref:DUF2828 family protein n=1 Tax=Mycolicibacterium phlei TaxID=1771 RepID=UPI00025AE725|nr:DUF2828 family protein [Mycolicibacterium phlei]EID10207.1 hypothetical protein MPHLEI_22464 [Mycolicibacterium phlei RIVM601174]MBF4194562.1 hypothetical protein [Mycolicibacterium phlei]
MTQFLNALRAETNYTSTENGALTNRSSLSAVVDFFSLAGAMRNTPERAADLFDAAFEEDPQTALRTLFYLRDIRGGQGERDIFRAGMRRFAARPEYQAALYPTIRLIPEYGRWDDIFFDGITPTVVKIIREQLRVDLLNHAAAPTEPVSLMAKWLPSENASSKATRQMARQLASELGYSSAGYRRVLSKLRARIKLLEQDMSANRWDDIEFSKLPSQAHRKHVKAFHRHVPERYQAYLNSVTRGESKINVKTVYPYEIYDMIRPSRYGKFEDSEYANVAWENLPDYTTDGDALVMADVSGSMWGRPMSVSVSLALYFAERNKGAYKGYFMTFSEHPQLVQVRGDTLARRMVNIERAEWGMNTNLSAAFQAILRAAKSSGEAPKVLYIISDMEFDEATDSRGRRSNDTVFRTARQEFAQAGFELPHVVFWNVNARNMQVPASILDGAVSLVSGSSPTVFAMAVEGKSPLQLVHEVVNAERYSRIVL